MPASSRSGTRRSSASAAYAAGLLAKHGLVTSRCSALLVAGLAAAVLGFATSFLVLRGSDLTRLMVTLGVALCCASSRTAIPSITGGADGLQGIAMAPVLGLFAFDLFGHTAYVYSLAVLFVLFLHRAAHRPLALRTVAAGDQGQSAAGVARSAFPSTGASSRSTRLAAFYAGVAGALLAQTTQFASLDVLAFDRSADVCSCWSSAASATSMAA